MTKVFGYQPTKKNKKFDIATWQFYSRVPALRPNYLEVPIFYLELCDLKDLTKMWKINETPHRVSTQTQDNH